MTTTTPTYVFVPNLQNHFGVSFNDPFSRPWRNPHAYAIIKPYVPSDDQEMTLTCKKVLDSTMLNTMTGEDAASGKQFTLDPVIGNVLTLLAPKDLANLSEVSKCSYSATKTDFVWIVQSNQFFPNVKIMDKSLCIFSPEQQFKIYFKRMNDELKPYICQFKKQDDLLKELRGPNGMDGKIHKAWEEMVQIGGIEGANETSNYLGWHDISLAPIKEELKAATFKYRYSNGERRALAGDDYNGTVETIDPSSLQGHCLTAIEILVPKAFDDQDRFEKTMQRAEAEKNGTSEAPADPFKPVKLAYSYSNDHTTDTLAPYTTDTTNPGDNVQEDNCIIS